MEQNLTTKALWGLVKPFWKAWGWGLGGSGEHSPSEVRQRPRSALPSFNRRAEASQLSLPAPGNHRRFSAGERPPDADTLPGLQSETAGHREGAVETDSHLARPGRRLDRAVRPRCIARADWQRRTACAPVLALYREPPAGPLTMGGASALVLGPS